MSRLMRWNPEARMRPWRRLGNFQLVPYWDTRVAMPMDIKEDQDAYIVKVSVPGFESQDIQLEVENGVLLIRAERQEEKDKEQKHWHVRERFSGVTERRLRLGEYVDREAIEAELEHGVLTLTLPKVQEAKPKLIPVQAE